MTGARVKVRIVAARSHVRFVLQMEAWRRVLQADVQHLSGHRRWIASREFSMWALANLPALEDHITKQARRKS